MWGGPQGTDFRQERILGEGRGGDAYGGGRKQVLSNESTWKGSAVRLVSLGGWEAEEWGLLGKAPEFALGIHSRFLS